MWNLYEIFSLQEVFSHIKPQVVIKGGFHCCTHTSCEIHVLSHIFSLCLPSLFNIHITFAEFRNVEISNEIILGLLLNSLLE